VQALSADKLGPADGGAAAAAPAAAAAGGGGGGMGGMLDSMLEDPDVKVRAGPPAGGRGMVPSRRRRACIRVNIANLKFSGLTQNLGQL
jgi:hypothetical protein